MKRTLLSLMLMLASLVSFAHDFEVNGIYYNILSMDDLTCEVTYRGTSSSSAVYRGDVVIPSQVSYANSVFNVTKIGYAAFSECQSLTSVTIPSSVNSIGSFAFNNCISLPSITIPNSVTSIGIYAFQGCKKLSSILLSNSLTFIAEGTFNICTNLQSINLPNSVRHIDESAFFQCRILREITIPSSVEEIAPTAFSWCERMTKINVVSDNPYYSSLDGVLFNKDQTVLVACPFGKSGSYTIPNSVTEIAERGFNDSRITSITIPSNVKKIGRNAFCGCSDLSSFTVSADHPYFSVRNGALYDKEKTLLVCCPGGKTGGFSIPTTVTTIGYGAFYGSKITSVNIPTSVTCIEGEAFFACSGLTSVKIPNSVTSLGEMAFDGCSNLTSITLSNSLDSIAAKTFINCFSISTITIPTSVKSIGEKAFAWCTALSTVTCKAIEPPVCQGSDVFSKKNVLKVYNSCADLYREAEVWRDFNKIQTLADTEEIANGVEAPCMTNQHDNESMKLYDLQGRKIQKGQKGIFIQNGKKVFVN